MSKLWERLTDWEKSQVHCFIKSCYVKLNIQMNLSRLENKNANVGLEAAEALVKIGKPAVPALVVALGDKDNTVRRHAARELGKIGDATAVPALIGALKDEDTTVRWKAAWALGRIARKEYKNKEVRAAVPALIVALKDENPDVMCRATDALIKIKPRNSDLLIIHSAAWKTRKEGGDTTRLRKIYDKWSKTLKGQADEIVEKKKLPKPRVPGKPDSVKRVKLKRVSA